MQAERVGAWLNRFIEGTYRPFLAKAVEWRYLTLAICLAMLVPSCAVPATGHMQFTFMPKIDGDVVVANLKMPVGTPVTVTEHYVDRLNSTLMETLEEFGGTEGVRGVYGRVGAPGTGDSGPMRPLQGSGANYAHVMVYLAPTDDREYAAGDFADSWRDRMGEIPGAESMTYSYEIGNSGGLPIDIRLSHPDPNTLELAADRLAQALSSFAGVRDIDNGFAPGKEQLDFTLTPEARALGITEIGLARQVRGSFYGAEALRQQRGRDEVRVVVRLPEEQRSSMRDLSN